MHLQGIKTSDFLVTKSPLCITKITKCSWAERGAVPGDSLQHTIENAFLLILGTAIGSFPGKETLQFPRVHIGLCYCNQGLNDGSFKGVF